MMEETTGTRIRRLRRERGMTQASLAAALSVSPKAVSKWENDKGLPDVALLAPLAAALGADLNALLAGGEAPEKGDNMKKTKFYVCPECGSITMSSGAAEIACCGRKLAALLPKKTEEAQRLRAEQVENNWYITSDHPMKKDDYISFVAFLTGDRLQVVKQYPEWDLSLRIEKRQHGTLLWYSEKEGLLYRYL
ncbi:MAG: helix-turn-helix domain-containing protein [Clostridiales bacterium]|nr:helix-turn-helix domain-containing protein [Clostridiales bacterium]